MVSTRLQNGEEISKGVKEIDKACESAGPVSKTSPRTVLVSTKTPSQSVRSATNTDISIADLPAPSSASGKTVSGSPDVQLKQEKLPASRKVTQRARRTTTKIDFTVSKVSTTRKTKAVVKSETVVKTELTIEKTTVSGAKSSRRGIKRELPIEGISSPPLLLDAS